MDDELDNEGMEEEGGSPKGGGGGNPIVKIGIIAVVVIAAALAVYGFVLPMFFGEAEEVSDEPVIEEIDYSVYGPEMIFDPSLTITMKDDMAKNRNRSLVVDVALELSSEGTKLEIEKRMGLVSQIIENKIKMFNFSVITLTATRDSIQVLITREIDKYLPKPDHVLIATRIKIVTQ